MKFNTSIPSLSIDRIIFTKLVLDCFIVVREDVKENIDSHKVELYSKELLTELHYTRISRATVIEVRSQDLSCVYNELLMYIYM